MPNLITKHKSTPRKLEDIDILILCGGQGTRLASVMGDKPKSLAEIKEKTFLDILMESILSQGFRKIILCVGHLKDQIKNKYEGIPGIFISEEALPLGTGGAVKNAEKFVQSKSFLVTNGDSIFTGLNFKKFYDFHEQQNGLISVALSAPRKDKDFGGVSISENNSISSFSEKSNLDVEKFMNGGVYLMKKEVLNLMPSSPFSLEYDFFPKFSGGSLYGFISPGEVIDIGTPERYEYAKKLLS